MVGAVSTPVPVELTVVAFGWYYRLQSLAASTPWLYVILLNISHTPSLTGLLQSNMTRAGCRLLQTIGGCPMPRFVCGMWHHTAPRSCPGTFLPGRRSRSCRLSALGLLQGNMGPALIYKSQSTAPRLRCLLLRVSCFLVSRPQLPQTARLLVAALPYRCIPTGGSFVPVSVTPGISLPQCTPLLLIVSFFRHPFPYSPL